MDVIAAVQNYVEKLITDPQLEGMKALILDAETKTIVSMVLSQSQILQREVFLVEQLDATHEPMLHLKAAVLLRPTAANVEQLKQELKTPKFGQYYLYFSNILPVELLERIAEADEHEVVQQVQEYYADYLAINDSLFHFNLRGTLALSIKGYAANAPSPTTAGVLTNGSPPGVAQLRTRCVEGVLAVLLSLKKRPVIRYQKGSEIAEKIAREVSARIQLEQDGLFDFRRPDVMPLLYVLDRKDDPVTPLLSQWTYQAMVHELLGLQENRVDLRKVPNVRSDMTEVVLSATSDEFFEKHMFANFGDLGMAVKELVDAYQAQAQTHENIESIEDMQHFVDNYPAFRSQSVAVSKHVTLMSELARLVEADSLMDVSQLEQEMVCGDDHNAHFKDLVAKLKNSRISPINKLRLALLYVIRYETNSSVQIKVVKDLLVAQGVDIERVQLIDCFIKYGGVQARHGDLFGDRGLKRFVRAIQGVQGVPNVYAQHVPPLIRHLETILKGNLLDTDFGIVNGTTTPGVKRVKDVIVFICGGVTFEEAAKVAELNQRVAATGQRVVLGGPYIHNSASFLAELAEAYSKTASGLRSIPMSTSASNSK